MFTKILITFIVLLGMGLTLLTAPTLKAQETAQEFDAQNIANEISKKVGNFEFSADTQCSRITARLTEMYDNMLCQINDYKAEKAQLLIDKIMSNYQIKAVNDWTEQGNYFTKIYVAEQLEEAPTINLVISDKIIFIGF